VVSVSQPKVCSKVAERFWDCDTIEEISDRCNGPVEYGSATPLAEPMYRMWVAVISGQCDLTISYGEPPERQ